MSGPAIDGYKYESAAAAHTDGYLLPTVRAELAGMVWPAAGPRRVFDLGCGTGASAAALTADGYQLTGVDPSADGIRMARQAYPALALHPASADDDLAAAYGQFTAVISLEVVEHVYHPRRFARCIADLLLPGGTALISTPYHGYLKNLALAVTGRMDAHFTALWDNGHIKFWSPRTLSDLLTEAGLEVVRCHRVGRVPPFAKSMVIVARRPA